MLINTESSEFEEAVMAVVRRRLGIKVEVTAESNESEMRVEVSLKDEGIELNYMTSDNVFTYDSN